MTIFSRFLIVLICSFGCINLYPNERGEDFSFPENKRQSLINLLQKYHFSRPVLDANNSAFKSVDAFSAYLELLDPYSKYYDIEHSNFIRSRASNSRIGIGVDLLVKKNDILVYPIINAPIFNKGLHSPVYLNKINGNKIDINRFESYSFMSNWTEDDLVNIDIFSENKIVPYQVKTKKYNKSSIYIKKKSGILVFEIREFNKQTRKLIFETLDKTDKNIPIVFDLRFCLGGDLFATVDILSKLLNKEKPIGFLDKKGKIIPLRTLKNKLKNKIKSNSVTIVTSKFTASSAELFIRSMVLYNSNTIVIGERTSGKCLAQYSFNLSDGSTLILSSYKILTPANISCEGVPIIPDIFIPEAELLSLDRILIHAKRN